MSKRCQRNLPVDGRCDPHAFRLRPGGGFDHVGEVGVQKWARRAGRSARAPRPTEQ